MELDSIHLSRPVSHDGLPRASVIWKRLSANPVSAADCRWGETLLSYTSAEMEKHGAHALIHIYTHRHFHRYAHRHSHTWIHTQTLPQIRTQTLTHLDTHTDTHTQIHTQTRAHTVSVSGSFTRFLLQLSQMSKRQQTKKMKKIRLMILKIDALALPMCFGLWFVTNN